MKVRIVRQSLKQVQGVALRHYQPQHVYDLPPSLADYLVAEGLAIFEMRSDDHPKPPPDQEERRRNH